MSVESGVGIAPADFGSRFSAFMIDSALLLGAIWVGFFVLSRQLQAAGLSAAEPCSPESALTCHGPSSGLWIVLTVYVLVLLVGYHAVFEGFRRATPGKHWMGLAVVGVDGQSPIGLGRGLARSVVRQSFWLTLLLVLEPSPFSLSVGAELFALLPALALAGLAIGAVLPSSRSVHDLAAASVVVRTADLPETPIASVASAASPSSTQESE